MGTNQFLFALSPSDGVVRRYRVISWGLISPLLRNNLQSLCGRSVPPSSGSFSFWDNYKFFTNGLTFCVASIDRKTVQSDWSVAIIIADVDSLVSELWRWPAAKSMGNHSSCDLTPKHFCELVLLAICLVGLCCLRLRKQAIKDGTIYANIFLSSDKSWNIVDKNLVFPNCHPYPYVGMTIYS